MTTIETDNFTRGNQSGFGGNWNAPVNGSATAAIVSNRGVFGNINNDTQMILGSHASTTDINMLVKLSTSDVNNLVGILWRYTSTSGGSGYRCGFFGSNTFNVDKYVSGSRSNIASASVTSYTANQDLWIRLIHTAAGALQIRWWTDGNTEPSNFNSPFINATETSFSSGNFGASVFINSGGTASYGSFTVTDNAAASTHSTQKYSARFYQITGVQKKFTSRLYQITGASKKFATRLYQIAAAPAKKYTSRFSQLVGVQKKYSARLFQSTHVAKAFVSRLYQLSGVQKAFESRFFQSTIAQKRFSTRFFQSALSKRAFLTRFYQSDKPAKQYKSRFYQYNHTNQIFSALFGHVDANLAQQIYKWRLCHAQRIAKSYTCRFGQISIQTNATLIVRSGSASLVVRSGSATLKARA